MDRGRQGWSSMIQESSSSKDQMKNSKVVHKNIFMTGNHNKPNDNFQYLHGRNNFVVEELEQRDSQDWTPEPFYTHNSHFQQGKYESYNFPNNDHGHHHVSQFRHRLPYRFIHHGRVPVNRKHSWGSLPEVGHKHTMKISPHHLEITP